MPGAVRLIASSRRLRRRFRVPTREPPAQMVFPAAPKNPARPTEAFSAFEGDVTEARSARVRSRRERRFENWRGWIFGVLTTAGIAHEQPPGELGGTNLAPPSTEQAEALNLGGRMPAPYEQQPPRKAPFEIWEPVDPPTPDDPPIAAVRSPALEIVGQPFELAPGVALDDIPSPTRTLRDLARIDMIVALGEPVPPKVRAPLSRETDGHKAVLPWLDRVGCMTTEQLRRATRPGASEKWIQGVLGDLLRARLVERRLAQLKAGGGRRRGGSGPWLWSLTAAGLRQGKAGRLPQDRTGLRAYGLLQIPEERRWRRSEARASAWLGHDLHALEWALAVCRLSSEWRTFGVLDVLTPRYLDGQLCPPRKLAVFGARPRPASLQDVPIDLGWRFRARRQLALPRVEPRPLTRDAARPEPVHQDAIPVCRGRRLVGALEANVGASPRPRRRHRGVSRSHGADGGAEVSAAGVSIATGRRPIRGSLDWMQSSSCR